MTHDYNTRVKKHVGNISNGADPLTNAKLEENIINSNQRQCKLSKRWVSKLKQHRN